MIVFTRGTRAEFVLVAGATTAQSQSVLSVDGNLETTHLLEQVCFRLCSLILCSQLVAA